VLVNNIEVTDSIISKGRPCLRAEVSRDGAPSSSEAYWFDVPEDCVHDLSRSGDPWLALCAPLAVHFGEPLRIRAGIDPILESNIRELMSIWNAWYPGLRPVPIEADTYESPVSEARGRTVALFSGGIDAWFTLLRHTNGASHPKIEEILSIWGLDIQLGNPAGFQKMLAVAEEVAATFAVNSIAMTTNLRETTWWHSAEWGRVGHGSALAACALVLAPRYRYLLIPSTHSYVDLVPWGSHPLTDPMLSTGALRIIHDGAASSRVDKTRLVATCDLALRTLQVCWDTGGYENCGHCDKCYRTMIALMLLGALDRCSTFRQSSIEMSAFSRVLLPHDASERAFLTELHDLAIEKGSWDLARALHRCARWGWVFKGASRLATNRSKSSFLQHLQQSVYRVGRFVFRRAT
jgi:hypothetical protein